MAISPPPSVDGRHLICARQVHKHYRRGQETVVALQDINLDVPRGAFAAVVGPSGGENRPCFTCWVAWTNRPRERSS